MNWFKKIAEQCEDLTEEGKSVEEDVNVQDVDPEELRMGIEIEFEHTNNRDLARKIALDHLTEIPDYYTRLKKMEEEALECRKPGEDSWSVCPIPPEGKDPEEVKQD